MFRPGIVFLDADTLGEISPYQLTRVGNLTVYQTTRADQRIERISGKEIVITNKVVIDRTVIDACPALKLICIAATGMNNVDLGYASEKGIRVMNVSAYSTESVVQHTFSMLFCLMGNLVYYDEFVKRAPMLKADRLPIMEGHFMNWPGKNLVSSVWALSGEGWLKLHRPSKPM